MINKDNFNESCEIIKDSVKISDYLLENKLIYDVDDKSLIRCPFDDHNDSTASFSYNDDKGLFNCFGCGRGGDVINLHYHMEKLDDERYSRIKAVKDLSKVFGITIPNMFERRFKRGRVNPYKYHKTELDDMGNTFYREKIRGLEKKIIKLNEKTQVKIYRKIDDVLLGRSNAKEVFFEIRGVMQSEGNKELL